MRTTAGGDGRIQGALRKRGQRVAASTIGTGAQGPRETPGTGSAHLVANVLACAVGRGSWQGLLHDRRMDAARAAPLYDMLFLIDLKTRRAHVAGLTTTPDGVFMAQVARTLT